MSYDVIVLGAGGMGSATAYHLARAGQRVLLLEQFALDHPNGSSFGNSRIIRYMYDHPAYVALAKAAYPMWRELEAEAGETLMHIIGGLDFGRANSPTLLATLSAVEKHGIPVIHLTPQEAMERFPQFQFGEDMLVFYQPDYGLLNASACVQAHARLAERHGAEIIDHAPVRGIEARDGSVTVHTARGDYSAERLVITAGAWTNDVLAPLGIELPLTVERVQYCLFRTSQPEDYQPSRFPVFISHLHDEYEHIPYGLPDYDGAGVKFAFHGGETVSDADTVDRRPDEDAADKLRPFLRDVIPGAADAVHLETYVCLYTMTPDQHFVIDTHPQHTNIVFATPCSGHGFKFSTLIGKILADLSLHGTCEYDLSLFQHTRFANYEPTA